MVQLGILLTRHHRLLSVAAMLDVFETVNRFYEGDGQPAFFEISLLHPHSSNPPAYSGHPVYPLQEAPRQTIILIPAFGSNDLQGAVSDNAECLNWLQQQHQRGTEIASFCTGAFLLAASGLLDKKPATTHIQSAMAFSKAFPMVQLQPSEITTFQQGIYTGGGATNSFHLMLRVLEKYCGRSMTLRVAKYFAIDMDREQQAYFGTFQPVLNHKDELVSALQQRIKSRFQETGTLEELLSEIPASRRNLARRFKAATGLTPIEYLQRTRIEAAKDLLEQTGQSILEVMLNTGYNDLKTFRQLFRKTTGMTPTAYRDKFYRKRMVDPALQ
jgi:transcriptional regulator GlxA family with amidase domain